jgi:glutaryl-CoA dehydrogenase
MFKSVARQTARQLSSRASAASAARRYAHTPAPFDWRDPLGASNMFTEEELAIAETAESYCQERMLPRVLGEFYIRLRPTAIADSSRGIQKRKLRQKDS